VSPQLRLGADLAFLPSITVKPDEGDSASVGSELHFGAVVEVVVDVSPQVAMALRGGLGPALAFPGGDWADQLDSDVEACDSLVADGTATDCTVNEGPFIGGALNLGLGLLIPVATGTSLRVDLRYQKMIGPDLDQRLETSVGNATWSGTFDTNRGILAAGAEF
jgi:hypothetical protein